jgi:uroporphyrin-III C-methyltransferase/precorrin-2 dehydrogenase/sirohydrochlorin ferrochelatase
MLPNALGTLAKKANALRPRVANEVPQGSRRRSFWNRFFFGAIRDAAIAGDEAGYAHELNIALADEALPSVGRVSLVGAGPGDPELLTLKAQRKLQEADVIVYDGEIDSGVLELARRDAVRIVTSRTQLEINATLIGAARSGKHVVHLVSGDIDNDSDEQAALEANGIAVEIVPGIATTTTKVFPFMSREDIAREILRAAS